MPAEELPKLEDFNYNHERRSGCWLGEHYEHWLVISHISMLDHYKSKAFISYCLIQQTEFLDDIPDLLNFGEDTYWESQLLPFDCLERLSSKST